MGNHQLQGWSADPFGVHEERYFSAGRATKLVRDRKVESYDDPPSATYRVPDEAAEAERFAPGLATAPARPAGGAPPPGGVRDPYAYTPGLAPGVPRRSRTPLVLAALAIVGGTIAGMVVLVKQSPAATAPSQTPAMSAAAFVSRSAGRTLAQRTADIALIGTSSSLGRTVTVTGTGEVDFSTNALSFDMNASLPGQSVTEKEILVNGSLFVALPISGTALAPLMGHREWLQMPASQWGSANLAGNDPVSSLSVLEQQGSSVRMLGYESIEGVNCTGYAVTPSRQALINAAKAEFAGPGYSSAETNQELSLVQGMPPPTVTVWLDAQGLVHQMSVSVSVPASALGASVSVSIAIDIYHYGTPVQITAPPASDTMSFQSLLKAANAKT
jgi:hypothetical protein